jgi:hypothetical protein
LGENPGVQIGPSSVGTPAGGTIETNPGKPRFFGQFTHTDAEAFFVWIELDWHSSVS